MKNIIDATSSTPVNLAVTVLLILVTCLILAHCKKSATPTPAPELRVDIQQVTDGFVSPLGVVAAPDHTGRLFVIDQIGKIWIIDSAGNKLSNPFIDVSSELPPLNAVYDERG